MDDERFAPGMPVLDRQALPDDASRSRVPSRVPETRPTRLQDAFIPISVVVLFCGVIAITALETGSTLGSPIVRVAVLLGSALLALVTLDALLRVWRSVSAWRPVDPGRAHFRLVWVATLALALALTVGAFWLALTA